MLDEAEKEEDDRHRRSMGDGDAEARDAGGEEEVWRRGFPSFLSLLLLDSVSFGGRN
mgnify:CR=1 FL=1